MGILMRAADEPSMTKIGGLPANVGSFTWPTCQQCSGAMQFLAQLRLGDSDDDAIRARPHIALVFMCQNDPGSCDSWEANSGANAVLLVEAGAGTYDLPDTGVTTLAKESPVALEPYDSSVMVKYGDDNYVALSDTATVLGKMGGNAFWLQGDETPECACGTTMQFVALLEERGGGGINFGGAGVGYVFVCTHCDHQGAFNFQC